VTGEYLARFEEIDGELFRFDTRIYLNAYDPSINSNCVGAIVGKNPGSAIPKTLNELVPLELNGDRMLPTVKNRFTDGYEMAKKQIPLNSFVRVWNLFYICDPDLGSACQKAANYKKLPTCNTENEGAPRDKQYKAPFYRKSKVFIWLESEDSRIICSILIV